MQHGRRRLVGLIGGSLAAAALPARGQPGARPWRIAVVQFVGGLMNRTNRGGMAFAAAMEELGYREGRDYILDDRQWKNQDEVPGIVLDLVRLKTDVIIAAAPPSIVGAKSVTDKVPIVMMYTAEPVAMGLVRSLNRPGGNLTGLTWDHGFETNLKALELLKETLPELRRVALIWDATDSVHPVYAGYFEKAAPQVHLGLVSTPLRQPADFGPAFRKMRGQRADALVILPSGQITIPHAKAIMALAERERLPTLFSAVGREFAGVLLYYGPNLSGAPRRAAAYVDRILRGANPAEIPIEQPEKYDLVVDLRTARKLGITVPHSILLRADKVIE